MISKHSSGASVLSADNDEEAVLSLVLVGLIRQNDLVVAGACRVGLHRPHAQLGLQEEVKTPVGQEFTVGQHLGQPAGEQVSLRGLTGQVDEGSDRKTGHVNVLVLGLEYSTE
jgi:hypothetical protein